MKHVLLLLLFALTTGLVVPAAYGQTPAEAARLKTREQLGQLLDKVGPAIKISFRQSQKQPFNFVGVLREGLKNADSFEVVIGVTGNQTIGFRIFPHYNGAYVNVDKAKNSLGLMRQLLRLSDEAFLYWGADQGGDIFAGYTFTLESGFPEAAITVVLRSVANLDGFVGSMKPNIDGAPAPVKYSSRGGPSLHLRTRNIRSESL
jgi:hypothetical protein